MAIVVIAGNPAKIVKQIPKEEFVIRKPAIEYYGYIRTDKFKKYFNKYMSHMVFNYDIKNVSNNELFK